MRKLTMTTFVSLDGVAQAPGGPEEDPSSGFEQGGWLVPFADEDMGEIMTEWFSHAGGFVLGRTTYEIFAGYWPHVGDDNPVANPLNRLPKYVASTTLDHVEWNNATLLEGDAADAVAALKDGDGADLQVHGSIGFAQTLMAHNLIDVYRLWVYPVVLGHGKRLFRDGLPTTLRLIDHVRTSTGVVVLTYEPAGPPEYGSFALDQ